MNIRRIFPVMAMALSILPFLHGEASQETVKKLFSQKASLGEFTKAMDEAAKAGAPVQLLAEAKLVWGLRHKDSAFLAKILPELEAAAANFKKEDSAGLGSVEEFKALISYIKALNAANQGDEAALKQHITEAFWLSPEQAPLFGETITFFRTQAKMAKVTVDMKLPVTNSKAEATTLADVLGKNKAVLLDFWASWCGPCMNLMPETRKIAKELGKHGVVVAGMNTEGDEGIAEKVRNEKDMKEVTWLVEPKAKPFSDQLEITSIPRMVLVSPQGKVLFNGHPQDKGLWAALKNVDPSIEEPKGE
jgi:thiol-disulfide isomerase/thioredoxin